MLRKHSIIKKEISHVTEYLIQFSTLLLILIASIVLYHFQHQFQEIKEIMFESKIGTFFFYFTILIVSLKVIILFYFLIQYLKYKQSNSFTDCELPKISIIVPAYNEGRFVFDTLISISESNYPKDKIQLLSIDDGSSDDTWEWMVKAKEKLDSFLMIYKLEYNQGKKNVLHKGFLLAENEIFVTIDSDSLIEKETLRNLVSPFTTDNQCGAVAGNVKIYNSKKTIIPKMLNVSFAYSFGFIRAAQSSMKTVLCTPGALSAYRKEAVMNCLDFWINQTYLNIKTEIGEDRTLTNMIIKQGYNVLFQSNAIVYTIVPETFKTLRKMFTRWERSNVIENIMMSKFIFSKFRKTNKLNARILLLNEWISMSYAIPSLFAMLLMIMVYPRLFFSSIICTITIYSILPAIYYAINYDKRNSIWIFTYNIFYSFTLFWITPYSILTSRRRGWLTRGKN
jgi:hyaluronan synthase